jgi:hypothetical protein
MHHVKDEMLEPNPKTVFGGPIPKMKGLNKCRDGRLKGRDGGLEGG